MDQILGILRYKNLERVCLERAEKEMREGRRKVSKNGFHLHVARNTSSGKTYEDSIVHPSGVTGRPQE